MQSIYFIVLFCLIIVHEMVIWDYSLDMTADSYIRNSDLFLNFTVTAPFPRVKNDGENVFEKLITKTPKSIVVVLNDSHLNVDFHIHF